jgi:hypothetical protein
MAELFQASKQNIKLHVRTLSKDNELEEATVVKKYLATAGDGKRYRTKHDTLSMILAIGNGRTSHQTMVDTIGSKWIYSCPAKPPMPGIEWKVIHKEPGYAA